MARKHSVSPKFISFHKTRTMETDNATVRDPCQISRLILSEFKQIDYLLFPRNHRFSDGFRGNRNWLFPLNSLNIRSNVWQQSLRIHNIEKIT